MSDTDRQAAVSLKFACIGCKLTYSKWSQCWHHLRWRICDARDMLSGLDITEEELMAWCEVRNMMLGFEQLSTDAQRRGGTARKKEILEIAEKLTRKAPETILIWTDTWMSRMADRLHEGLDSPPTLPPSCPTEAYETEKDQEVEKVIRGFAKLMFVEQRSGTARKKEILNIIEYVMRSLEVFSGEGKDTPPPPPLEYFETKGKGEAKGKGEGWYYGQAIGKARVGKGKAMRLRRLARKSPSENAVEECMRR